MSTLSKMDDPELIAWARNLIAVADPNPTAFGLTAAIIADLATEADQLESKMTARYAADEVAHAAVKAQEMGRESFEPKCSYARATVKKAPNLPDDEKVRAGAPPDKTPTSTPPTIPTGLLVNGYQSGGNVLVWKTTGNKAGTQYVIEYRLGEATEFSFLDVTTEATYTHEDAIPGQPCSYRVRAQRANEKSAYSNVAVIYTN